MSENFVRMLGEAPPPRPVHPPRPLAVWMGGGGAERATRPDPAVERARAVAARKSTRRGGEKQHVPWRREIAGGDARRAALEGATARQSTAAAPAGATRVLAVENWRFDCRIFSSHRPPPPGGFRRNVRDPPAGS